MLAFLKDLYPVFDVFPFVWEPAVVFDIFKVGSMRCNNLHLFPMHLVLFMHVFLEPGVQLFEAGSHRGHVPIQLSNTDPDFSHDLLTGAFVSRVLQDVCEFVDVCEFD